MHEGGYVHIFYFCAVRDRRPCGEFFYFIVCGTLPLIQRESRRAFKIIVKIARNLFSFKVYEGEFVCAERVFGYGYLEVLKGICQERDFVCGKREGSAEADFFFTFSRLKFFM